MPAKKCHSGSERRKLAQSHSSDKECLIGTGIIDAIDMCAPKTMMLVSPEQMFVAAEPIKKDVFAIFPARLFYFHHIRDSRTQSIRAYSTSDNVSPNTQS